MSAKTSRDVLKATQRETLTFRLILPISVRTIGLSCDQCLHDVVKRDAASIRIRPHVVLWHLCASDPAHFRQLMVFSNHEYWNLLKRNSSYKNENFLKMYTPAGHLKCRWVCFFIRTDLENFFRAAANDYFYCRLIYRFYFYNFFSRLIYRLFF